jgi:hypothetical protein
MGMRASVVDFLRHKLGCTNSWPLARANQPGASEPLAHPSTWISLVGLRPRIAQLRFTRHDYVTPNNELITEVEANQIGAV